MTEQNNDLDQQLQTALDSFDGITAKATPSAQWFESFVAERQRELKRRLRRDVLLFLFTAFVIVTGMIISLTFGIEALILFQVVVTFAITLPFVIRRKERTDAP